MTVAAHRFDNDRRYRDGGHPSQTWFTPSYVLDLVREDLGGAIGLDPCTTDDNPVGAERYFTLREDGLSRSWIGPKWKPTVFVNPPYGEAREPWVERFVKGRLKFGVLRPNRRQVASSHPSSLIGWNTSLDACSALGFVA